MTGFGVYLVIYYILNLCAAFYYIGQGGYEVGPGALLFSVIWLTLNLLGILFLGTGFGV